MQGRIQKWVDHSISVTINLPNDVDEDLVNRLYVEAWKSGCKGCTVYRDGSRSGVLISAKSDKKEEMPPCKPPTVVETRPTVLDADIVRFQNNKEKWVAFVGLLDGHPYEIFTGLQDDDEGIILPKNVTSGHIIKKVDKDGSKRYDFQFQNKRGYKVTIEGLSEKFNKEKMEFTYYGRQRIERRTNVLTRELVTAGQLKRVPRTDNNPHGLLIVNWRTLLNKDIDQKTKSNY